MKHICFVPAKSHSRRLPNKNFLLLNRRPIVQYVLDTLRHSSLFDEIFLSTDGIPLRTKLELDGITLLERPEYLATDDASIMDVMEHVVPEVFKAGKYDPSDTWISIMLPTAVLLRPSDLVGAFKCAFETGDPVMVMAETPYHPTWLLMKRYRNWQTSG